MPKIVLPEETVRQMAKDHVSGLNVVKIAKKYGVSNSVVTRLLKEYSQESSWYDYETTSYQNRSIAAQKSHQKSNSQHFIEPSLMSSVYTTFIRTHESLGVPKHVIWQKIKEIETKYECKIG